MSAVTDELFEAADMSTLKQILIDNLSDDDDNFISELSYQNCRITEGIYIDEGPRTPGIFEIHLLLESASEWFAMG